MVEALNISGLVRTAVSICANLAPLLTALSKTSTDPPSIGGVGNKDHLSYITELTLMTVAILRHRQRYVFCNKFVINQYLFGYDVIITNYDVFRTRVFIIFNV